MALDKGGAGGRKKRHWAYMRYRTGGSMAYVKGKGNQYVGGHWIKRWVKVGSPLYNQLLANGRKPIVIKAGKRPPNTLKPGNTKGASLDGVRVGGDGPKIGTKKGDKAMDRVSGKGGGSFGSGKGSKGGRRGGGKGKGGGSNSAQTTAAINKQLGSSSPGKKLGAQYAGAMAGLQFDAPIKDLKTLIDRLGPQNAQAMEDLGQWYGDVSTLNARSGARAQEITSQTADAQGQAVQGLLEALGGSSNAANPVLAAQQANDDAYTRILGGIEQQYHSDMDPILAHAEAAAKTREQRLNQTQMQDYQLQLADLLGQRGQAKASNQMQVDQYNNELAQQWFQNKLAKLNAALGAQAAGVDMQVKRAGLRQAKQQQRKESSVTNWRGLNAAERDDLLQRATGAFRKADGTIGTSRSYVEAQRYLSGLLKHPVGSGKNPGLLTALYQYYH